MGSAGTKERIVAQSKYNPQRQWSRERKSINETVKKIGDYIIAPNHTIKITRQGHKHLPVK